jgi:UDP-4-amino-4-deoxy-L-arabinose-oxoglutarate aminotransferase
MVDASSLLSRPLVPASARSARHLYTIWLADGRRDHLLRHLGANNIGCAVNYRAIHCLSWLADNVELRFPLPVAEWIGEQTLSLPLYDRLTDAEIDRVCDVIEEYERDV